MASSPPISAPSVLPSTSVAPHEQTQDSDLKLKLDEEFYPFLVPEDLYLDDLKLSAFLRNLSLFSSPPETDKPDTAGLIPPTPTVDYKYASVRLYLDHSISNGLMLLLDLKDGPMLRGAGFMWSPGEEKDFSFEGTMIRDSFRSFEYVNESNWQSSFSFLDDPLSDIFTSQAEWEAATISAQGILETLADDLKAIIDEYKFPIISDFNERHRREVLRKYREDGDGVTAAEFPSYGLDIVRLLDDIYRMDIPKDVRDEAYDMAVTAFIDIRKLFVKAPREKLEKYIQFIKENGLEGALDAAGYYGQSLGKRWDIGGGFMDLMTIDQGKNHFHANGSKVGAGHGETELFSRYSVEQGGQQYTLDRITAMTADVYGRAFADIALNFSQGASVFDVATQNPDIAEGLGNELDLENIDELLELFPGLNILLLDARLSAKLGYEFITRLTLSESFIQTWRDLDREYSFGLSTLATQQISESDTISLGGSIDTTRGRLSFDYSDVQKREVTNERGSAAFGRVAQTKPDEWFFQLALGLAATNRITHTRIRTFATEGTFTVAGTADIQENNPPEQKLYDNDFRARPLINVVAGLDGVEKVNPYLSLTTFPGQALETGVMGGVSLFPAYWDLAGKLSLATSFPMIEPELYNLITQRAAFEIGMTFFDAQGAENMLTHYQNALKTAAIPVIGRGTYQLEADHIFYEDLEGLYLKTGVDTDTMTHKGHIELVYGKDGPGYAGVGYTTDLKSLASGDVPLTHIGRLLAGWDGFHLDFLAGLHANEQQHGNTWGFAMGGELFGGNWTLDLFAEPLKHKDPREYGQPVLSADKKTVAWEQRPLKTDEPEIEAYLTFSIPMDNLVDAVQDFTDGAERFEERFRETLEKFEKWLDKVQKQVVDPRLSKDVSAILGG